MKKFRVRRVVEFIISDSELEEGVTAESLQERLEDDPDEMEELSASASRFIYDELTVTDFAEPDGPYREPVRVGEFAGSPEAADAVVIDDRADYEIVILDQGFEPEYNGWNVRFQAIGAPRFSYSQVDPVLDAYIKLEAAPSMAPRLGSGGGSSLARTDEASMADVMLGGGAEGAVLRGALGAAMVDVFRPTATPKALPSDEAIAAACQKALAVHIEAVKAERARLDITEGGESVIGKKLRVKG